MRSDSSPLGHMVLAATSEGYFALVSCHCMELTDPNDDKMLIKLSWIQLQMGRQPRLYFSTAHWVGSGAYSRG